MWEWIHKAGSPKTCYRWCRAWQPWFATLCLVLLLVGLIDGLLFAPVDYQQGNAYRILFLHVPSAILSLFIYTTMAVSAFLFLVWKIKVADMVAEVSAPIGALFTALTLITGALWGRPTWGTFWIWDARLTSELILLFIYFGIMALRSAVPDQRASSKITSIMILIGAVNIPIIHYSVDWWHTLHQGATILKLGKPSISIAMLVPLLIMLAAFFLYFAWQLCARLRSELVSRDLESRWVKEL